MQDFTLYIGLSYDPINFNCWHLVKKVQQECFRRDLPDFDVHGADLRKVAKTFDTAAERQNWQRIKKPTHGCCVLMRRARLPIHIGVWLDIDGGGILHNLENIGVVFQSRLNLSGLNIEGYYDHD